MTKEDKKMTMKKMTTKKCDEGEGEGEGEGEEMKKDKERR